MARRDWKHAFRCGGFRCEDCGVNTSLCGHYYVVTTELWRKAAADGASYLCLDCLERRIGRPLVVDDFLDLPQEMAIDELVADAEGVKTLSAEERQRELADWRAFVQSDEWRDFVLGRIDMPGLLRPNRGRAGEF